MPIQISQFQPEKVIVSADQNLNKPTLLSAIETLASNTINIANALSVSTIRDLAAASSTSLVLINPEPIPEPESSTSVIPKKEKPNLLYTLARKTMHGVIAMDNIDLTIKGIENLQNHHKAAVLVANHHSFTDGMIVGAKLKEEKVHFVIKADMFKGPLRSFLKSTGAVPMVRGGGAGSEKSLQEVIKLLKEGHKVCMFPEGTLAKDLKIHKGKAGVAYTILGSQADYIPVSIRGPRLRKDCNLSPLKMKKIEVTIGKPVSADTLIKRSLGDDATLKTTQEAVKEKSKAAKEMLDKLVSTVMHDIQDTLNGELKKGDAGFVDYVDTTLKYPGQK